MEPKILKNTFKKKLQNHITEKGKTQVSEKGLIVGMKLTQKSKKKNAAKLMKLAAFNVIPVLRIMSLRDKRRKKKSLNKEIPGFLSTRDHRLSWGLKNLTKVAKLETNRKNLSLELKNKFLAATEEESKIIELKNNFQNDALKNKIFFRYYQW